MTTKGLVFVLGLPRLPTPAPSLQLFVVCNSKNNGKNRKTKSEKRAASNDDASTTGHSPSFMLAYTRIEGSFGSASSPFPIRIRFASFNDLQSMCSFLFTIYPRRCCCVSCILPVDICTCRYVCTYVASVVVNRFRLSKCRGNVPLVRWAVDRHIL